MRPARSNSSEANCIEISDSDNSDNDGKVSGKNISDKVSHDINCNGNRSSRIVDDDEIINMLDDPITLSSENEDHDSDDDCINRDVKTLSKRPTNQSLSQLSHRSSSLSPIFDSSSRPKKRRRFIRDSEDEDDPKESCVEIDEISIIKENVKHKNGDDIEFDEDDSNDASDHGSDDEILNELYEDSDVDEQKNFKKISTKGLGLRQRVVEFMQTATVADLESIPGVKNKKVPLLMAMRPIKSWEDLKRKIENHPSSGITDDILINAANIIKSRDTVARLMTECENLSKDIVKLVDRLPEAEQPKCLNPEMKLKPYQLVGLNWLCLMYNRGINAILADEMGLGKTIQVIAFIAHLRENYGIKQHFLVVVPSSTLDNWEREFDKWCPDILTLQYYGSQEERAQIRYAIAQHKNEFDVILTTYNVILNPDDKKMLKKINFEYLVFDEAHMLKNMKTIRYQNLVKIKSKRRILLTGTPLQNNLIELMSLLVFAMPRMFMSKMSHVDAVFSSASRKEGQRTTFEAERVEQAKKIMRPFVLRRFKKDVLSNLPAKTEETLKCPMSKRQSQLYHEMVDSFAQKIKSNEVQVLDTDESFAESAADNAKSGTGMLMSMRRISNHPLLLLNRYTPEMLRQMSYLMLREPTHRDANPDLIYEDMSVMHDFELHMLCKRYKSLERFILPDEDILDSGKFGKMDRLLEQIVESKQRCLLFSQFVMMLDIFEEYLKIRKYRFVRLDGATKVTDRLALIDEFNNDEDVFIFLLSTKAGGLGINLTSASVVIIHDIDFNPYNDKQAEDRAHRVGQTKDVTVYRLISEDTVEEGILNIANEKLRLGRDIAEYEEGQQTTKNIVTAKDLKCLLRQALKI